MDELLTVSLRDVVFKNPLIAASGVVGYGKEYEKFFPLSVLGGISVKGTTKEPRLGNSCPRVAETASGMLNSIGLENPGIEVFIKEYLPYLLKKRTVVIANIAGSSISEYEYLSERLNETDVHLIELNISCPNVEKAGLVFGSSSSQILNVVSAVRKKTSKPLVVKLSPNVTSIVEMAKAAEAAGADAICLINTLLGMKIDIKSKRPILKNNMGGLSGPCILPVAVRMVWQTFKEVSIPIIGCGGISTYEDALEIMMAGASFFQIGTVLFNDLTAPIKILDGLKEYLKQQKIKNIKEIVGSVLDW